MPAKDCLSGPIISADNSMPAAVLWDMDGTLVDSEKVWTVSLAETARWLGGELSAAAREDMVGSNMARSLAILFDDLGLARDPLRMAEAEQWLTVRTGELFAAGLEWRPGALEALGTVRAAGWPTALVTNTGRALTEMALESIGREHFTVTVCGDEVPRGKPDPDPYLRAADLLGVSAAECLAVEDSPAGSIGARLSGSRPRTSVTVTPRREANAWRNHVRTIAVPVERAETRWRTVDSAPSGAAGAPGAHDRVGH
jgi:HAD superfamily hydrolase (TIGR01509 family)